jgi:hypothetical protein
VVLTADGRADTAPNRPAPDLTPTASPVSVYAPRRTTSQAAALASVSSPRRWASSTRRSTAFTQDAPRTRAKQEAAAENKIGGMTFDEAQKGVHEGSMSEMQNPWFKAAFMKQFGQRVALRKAQELTDQYQNGFNKDGGDVEKLVAGSAKPVLDQYGNDKHFASGFNGVFGPQAAKIRNEQATYQSTRVNNEVRQGVYEIGTAIIGDGISKGKSADDIVATASARPTPATSSS